jgi:predicted dienelactone hydrolase
MRTLRIRSARFFGLAVVVTLVLLAPVAHAEGPYHAGITRITVQDMVPFDALVAYPTDAAEAPFQSGPFTIQASRDAPIAATKIFPVLLLSHGNGRSAGTSVAFRDLIAALARQGFIVIAPFHPGTSLPLQARPRQLHQALDQVLADQRFAAHADRARLGVIGFSFGGAVALIAAGARPNLGHLVAYCRDRTDDPMACDGLDPNEASQGIPAQSADVLPVKALVLLEPFGAVFSRETLTAVRVPVLLYRAERSKLGAEGNIFALAAALPVPPRLETIPGGHFVFFDPCPPAVEKEAVAVCTDDADVDRATIHRRLETEIADFLRNNI